MTCVGLGANEPLIVEQFPIGPKQKVDVTTVAWAVAQRMNPASAAIVGSLQYMKNLSLWLFCQQLTYYEFVITDLG
jgi:hypothetical protein